MKTFFKVLTIFTMGLLFTMTNDGMAAAEESPSPLAGLLGAAQGPFPEELSSKVLGFLGGSDLGRLGSVCKATRAISASTRL